MAGEYSYDETGQYNFFLITFLTFILVPWTIYTIRNVGKDQATSKVKPPCEGWNQKAESIRRSRKSNFGLSKTNLLLALGWVAFAFVLQRAYSYESVTIFYDPYSILGISTGMAEKDIKRHYRKLSLKFHPDKLVLADNQTKEEADAHFVELTKAYKALTDETIRQNYEQYGHPDGKQEFSMGIALPSWIVEGKNNVYVLGVYGLLFGVCLPWFVGSWWYGSRRYTKDGVSTSSADTFFKEIKEETTLAQLVEIISAAKEFKDRSEAKHKLSFKRKGYEALREKVEQKLKETTGETLEGKLYRDKATKRAAVFIYAHLLRVPIDDVALLRDKNYVVETASKLCISIMNITLSFNWLSTYLTAVALQQYLVQALHPSLSPVLQLPGITTDQAEQLAKHSITSVPSFANAATADQRSAALQDLSDKERARAVKVAENWPTLDVIDAKFQVVGEKIITPGCFVQLVVKVKLSPPGSKASASPTLQVNGETDQLTKVEQGEEKDLDELIGRRKAGALGESPDPVVHAPYFPINRLPAWYVFVGDHKLGRVFVPPTRFRQFGAGGASSKVRTLQLTFQAPPNPGLYTFQMYVKSDSYVGADAQKDMMMQVQPPQAAEQGDADDDISEPEEDSLAGQMAAMRGQPVKRIDGEEVAEDEYTSSDSEEEEESSSSSSDSDSD